MSQEISFCQELGIDFIQAAKSELQFLEEVSTYPNLSGGPLVRNAIRRYELCWLPLASQYLSDAQLAAPPLDVAWVWHAHMLAPQYYQKDCYNILSKVLDHSPLDRTQRDRAQHAVEGIWRQTYPDEPFHVDLTKSPTTVTSYQSKIQYNLEEACSRQFKFNYQVSLPHYRDELFLKRAFERYEHFLRLTRLHPDVFMVPCYDFDLIWHTHQLYPVRYNQTTKQLVGKLLHHDDTEKDRAPGSKLYDSEMKSRDLCEAEGLSFYKLGAMYRGEQPDPIPSRPRWLYAQLARSEYTCEIQDIEALGFERNTKFVIQLENKLGQNLFSQSFTGNEITSVNLPTKLNFDKGTKLAIDVCLYKKRLLGKKIITRNEIDLFPLFPEPFSGVISQRFTVDVPLDRGQYMVKVLLKLNRPTIVEYIFEGKREGGHPSPTPSSQFLMLSLSDLGKPFSPVFDWRGNQVFGCQFVQSSISDALFPAAQIINVSNQVVATTHTISQKTLPARDDVQDHDNSIFLADGERAMLIRSNKDWAMCIGKEDSLQDRVKIKVYKLAGAERGWCSVNELNGGLYLIKTDSDTLVRIDLKRNKVVISPRAQDIPEVLALAFSVSMFHRLCMRKQPPPPKVTTRSSYSGAISSSFNSRSYWSVFGGGGGSDASGGCCGGGGGGGGGGCGGGC